MRSKDSGQEWQPTIDLHSDVHQVLTVPNRPDLVVAAVAKGLAISIDGGDSWSFDRANLHATYSRAVAVCGETVLISTSIGPSGGKAAIYRRLLDQPGTFEKCQQGLPQWFSDNINTGSLAALEDKAAFGTSDGNTVRIRSILVLNGQGDKGLGGQGERTKFISHRLFPLSPCLLVPLSIPD